MRYPVVPISAPRLVPIRTLAPPIPLQPMMIQPQPIMNFRPQIGTSKDVSLIPASIPYRDRETIVIEEDPKIPTEVVTIEDGDNQGTVISGLKKDKNSAKPMDTIISNSDTDEMDEFNTSTDLDPDQSENENSGSQNQDLGDMSKAKIGPHIVFVPDNL